MSFASNLARKCFPGFLHDWSLPPPLPLAPPPPAALAAEPLPVADDDDEADIVKPAVAGLALLEEEPPLPPPLLLLLLFLLLLLDAREGIVAEPLRSPAYDEDVLTEAEPAAVEETPLLTDEAGVLGIGGYWGLRWLLWCCGGRRRRCCCWCIIGYAAVRVIVLPGC